MIAMKSLGKTQAKPWHVYNEHNSKVINMVGFKDVRRKLNPNNKVAVNNSDGTLFWFWKEQGWL